MVATFVLPRTSSTAFECQVRVVPRVDTFPIPSHHRLPFFRILLNQPSGEPTSYLSNLEAFGRARIIESPVNQLLIFQGNVIRAQGWGTRTPTRFLESNDSGLSRSTNNRGRRDTNRCEIINRTDSRHFPVLYARGMKILGTSINHRTRMLRAGICI